VRIVIALLCLMFAATLGIAQDKKDKDAKKPSAAQKEQQQRMKDCNKQASSKKMKGDERQKFMSTCLKDDDQPSPAQKAQQERMTACNKQATEKKLKGDDRKKFMSGCLKS